MREPVTQVGLRIDVDTYRGTLKGVPRLLDILARHEIRASFFFTVGPDNMGRHLWRLLRPDFVKKMLRSRASSLYGYDILLKGTLWPGPDIGWKLGHLIRQTHQMQHETGLHAWDHHRWQTRIDRMNPAEIHREIEQGHHRLEMLLDAPVTCSAVAGWRCNETALVEKERFSFRYNSDCRGESIFMPEGLGTPQIPVTLPTYDELIGQHGVTDDNYNQHILERIEPGRLNVYTIHAEAEGIACASMFEKFLVAAAGRGIRFVPLGALLPADLNTLPVGRLEKTGLSGREGWVARQAILS
ncbi:putative 4-deoxy-4-formamido-L-arabinose-phosphoundecaprenol deformylase ArnD [Kushneria pakistanensis]|uniref:Probable 4-deoxy-4-formamido-L-arabinose-phosphoundecaprenol deformylase ArnD n=1 Tax=Kushneria pakistanensis TaxID=1508770 RepID=A0ABQ3FQR7_9GAMM|nr:4-deoxy-4-formamido-L-arabinose-phosphoundecaprenol deformylase [Kushneria pakistanensis]GHC32970.1 putative 4-deoxy-4-formamido-L-arabinose-phosphoundecaprenol deformylase ArnD [Kushneria pakistanensis]